MRATVATGLAGQSQLIELLIAKKQFRKYTHPFGETGRQKSKSILKSKELKNSNWMTPASSTQKHLLKNSQMLKKLNCEPSSKPLFRQAKI